MKKSEKTKRKIDLGIILVLLVVFVGGLFFGYLYSEIQLDVRWKNDMQKSLQSNTEDSFWKLFNKYRQKNNLQPLQINEGICKVADKRAKEASENWSHEGWRSFDLNKECRACYHFGENLGEFHNQPQELLDAWIESPSHKENLDDPVFKYGCLGIYGVGGSFFTALELAG